MRRYSRLTELIFGALLLGTSAHPSYPQDPQQMVATTPFGQSKVTDGAGNVSFRVGGVFAPAGDNSRRLSLTFVCRNPRTLSFFTVQMRVPRNTSKGSAKISLQVDDQAPQVIEAAREVGSGLSAYTVSSTADVVAIIKRMGAGNRLRMQLDDFVYDLPLEGLGNELRRLQSDCPYE